MSYTRFFPQPSETVSYQWHVSPRFKFAYNAIPKAATTGILRALQMAEVDGDESKIGQPHERDHSPLKRIEELGLELAQVLTGNDYFRFTYVRNPITRILSAYLDKMVRHEHERWRLSVDLGLPLDAPPTLLAFLQAVHNQRDSWRDIHWQTQSRLVQRSNVEYHFIGRFEDWRSSLPTVVRRAGVKGAKVLDWIGEPPHATAASQSVREHVGQAELDLILTIYDADFWTFNYSPDLALCGL